MFLLIKIKDIGLIESRSELRTIQADFFSSKKFEFEILERVTLEPRPGASKKVHQKKSA